MKNKKNAYYWGTLLCTSLLGISMAVPSFAASTDTPAKLDAPAWSTSLFAAPINNPDSSEVDAIKVIPSQSLVYVKSSHLEHHPNSTPNSDTNNQWIDTFTAYSTQNGKQLWSYNNLGEPGDLGTTQYASNGSVYFCNQYPDGHYKLTSLHASGKVNWKVQLPMIDNALPYELDRMKDGSLLVSVAVHTDSEGNAKSILKRYDAKGHLLQQKTVNGYVMAASGNRIIVDASHYKNSKTSLQHARVTVYRTDLDLLYSYTSVLEFDHYDDQMAVLDNGSVLIGTYKPDVGNVLVQFDTNGKITSKRPVSDDYSIQSTGSGYLLYDHQLFKSYDASSAKPVASVTLKGTPADANWMQPTNDGNLMMTMMDRTYILNPSTHSIVSAWYRTSDDITFDYDNQAVYTNQGKGILAKYVIQ